MDWLAPTGWSSPPEENQPPHACHSRGTRGGIHLKTTEAQSLSYKAQQDLPDKVANYSRLQGDAKLLAGGLILAK